MSDALLESSYPKNIKLTFMQESYALYKTRP